MPEVCEVALTTEILKQELLHYDLTEINVTEKKFKKIPKNLSNIRKKLPLSVVDINSKGKMMWIKYDEDIYMTVGFGLEGKWSFEEETYSKMNFVFESKKKEKVLWWNDIFSYGNIVFYTNKSDFVKKLNTLGMDFLKSSYTKTDIYQSIKKIKETKYADKMIVELLMNQKKLGSGLGNYLSADVLYVAKLKPSRKIKSITESESNALTLAIKRVIKTAYYHNDNRYMEYLHDYLEDHKRNSKYLNDVNIFKTGKSFKFFVYKRKKDDNNNDVLADKLIKGRTTYWSPKVQK